MKQALGKTMVKEFNFCGEKVKVRKLTYGQVLEIQNLAKSFGDAPTEDQNMQMLRFILRSAVDSAEELTDDDFLSYPLEDLGKLSNDVMAWSGLAVGNDKK